MKNNNPYILPEMAREIEAFERREAILDLHEKLFTAEQQRLSGESTISLDNAFKKIKDKINEKI